MSPEHIRTLVDQAFAEGVPIDRLANCALFPEGGHDDTARWTRELWREWYSIVEAYADARKDAVRAAVDREQAWAAMEASQRDPLVCRRLSWDDLAQRLGLGVRSTQYQLMGRLHFRFRYGGNPQARELVSGPCRECGEILPAEHLYGGYCADHAVP